MYCIHCIYVSDVDYWCFATVKVLLKKLLQLLVSNGRVWLLCCRVASILDTHMLVSHSKPHRWNQGSVCGQGLKLGANKVR